MLRAFGATGLRLARSFALLIPTSAYTHIFAAAGTLRVPLSQPQKRHIPPERYVTWHQIFLENNILKQQLISILKKYKKSYRFSTIDNF
jgi:hypothetical protein